MFVSNNNSQLPPNLCYKPNERLSSVKTTNDGILKIKAKLDPNKKDVYFFCTIKQNTEMCNITKYRNEYRNRKQKTKYIKQYNEFTNTQNILSHKWLKITTDLDHNF